MYPGVKKKECEKNGGGYVFESLETEIVSATVVVFHTE